MIQGHVNSIAQFFTDAKKVLDAIDPDNPSTYKDLMKQCRFCPGDDKNQEKAWREVLVELKKFVDKMNECMQDASAKPIRIVCEAAADKKDPSKEAHVICRGYGIGCDREIHFFPLFFTNTDPKAARAVVLNELTHVCLDATDGHGNSLKQFFLDSNEMDSLVKRDKITDHANTGGVLCDLANRKSKGQEVPRVKK